MAPKQHPWESTIKQVAALLSGGAALVSILSFVSGRRPQAAPAPADGEVGDWAVPPHAATLTTAANAKPARRKLLVIVELLRC